MQVSISTRHGHLSPATQEKITEKLQKLRKFYDRISAASVTVDLEFEADPSIEIILSVEHSPDVVAHTAGSGLWGTLDGAIEKLEKQLRKLKEKTKDHKTPSPKRQESGPGEAEV